MRDVFVDKAEMTRFASHIAATWSITLAAAPVLGGYIQSFLGWRFYIVTGRALEVFKNRLAEALDG